MEEGKREFQSTEKKPWYLQISIAKEKKIYYILCPFTLQHSLSVATTNIENELLDHRMDVVFFVLSGIQFVENLVDVQTFTGRNSVPLGQARRTAWRPAIRTRYFNKRYE